MRRARNAALADMGGVLRSLVGVWSKGMTPVTTTAGRAVGAGGDEVQNKYSIQDQVSK